MRHKRFLLFFLIFPFLLQAQESPDQWYQGKPLDTFEFVGLQTIRYNDIVGVLERFQDQPFSDQLFRELQLSLYSLDYFTGAINAEVFTVDEGQTRVGIRFTVTEKPSIRRITFEGAFRLNDGELLDVINLKEDSLLQTTRQRLDEQAIKDLYFEKGYIQATVSSRIDDLGENNVELVFEINEGNQTTVKAILFEGNDFANDNDLLGIMETQPVALFNNGIFRDATLVSDKERIEAWYQNRGYVDAKVLRVDREVEINQETGTNQLTLQVVLEEGDQYNFGGMSFSGNEIYTTELLMSNVRHPIGEILNRERLLRDINAVMNVYRDDGYIFTDLDFTETREDNTITYAVNIIEKPKAHIENIIVRGNNKTLPEVILREIPLETGDAFSTGKIQEGYQNLFNTGYFEAVNLDSAFGSTEGLMDLIIDVEEAQTTQILFALTFSGVEQFPITGQLSWNESNFMGTGRTIGVTTELSPTNQSLRFNFQDNWFLDERFTIGANLSFGHFLLADSYQDVLAPTYSDGDDAVPDPYDANVYVFTRSYTYGGVSYSSGDIFPGIPPSSLIDDGIVVNEYEYDQSIDRIRSNNYTMEYDSYNFSLAVNLGYSWVFPFGRISLGGGGGPSLSYVTYDSESFRPFNSSLRENLNQWRFVNSAYTRAAFDSRDFFFYASSGILLSQTFSQSGGLFGGLTHFFKSESKFEFYHTLWDTMLGDDFNFKGIFMAKTGLSMMFDAFGSDDGFVTRPSDKLAIYGYLQGRGWGQQTNGKYSWYQNLELRMPIIPNFLSWETFLDGFVLLGDNQDPEELTNIDNFKFSWGTGLRITNPQIPLGIYFAKPFTIDSNGNINAVRGDGFFGDFLDMNFVFALTIDI